MVVTTHQVPVQLYAPFALPEKKTLIEKKQMLKYSIFEMSTILSSLFNKYVWLTLRVQNLTLLSISLVISYVNIELLPWINTRCWM